MGDFWAWVLGYPYRRSVIVVTKTDKTFRGVLWNRTDEVIVLKGVEQLERARNEPIPLVGDLVIPRGNVDYIQVRPG